MSNSLLTYKKKKKLGSFPYVSMIFSIALALFVIGLFGLLILQSNKLKDSIQENIAIQIYLDKSVTENDIIRINKLLKQKRYVLKEGDNSSVEFVSKEDAAKVFIERTGEDFIEFLGDNPLRDAFSVKIDPAYQQVDSLQNIKSDLGKIDSVFEIAYAQNLVQSINKNITKISLVLIGFTLVLLITIVVLINNTIKLALFSQRFLIRSMQLVGAKAGFIIAPFLRRAARHGIVAGMLASALLFILLTYANSVVEELKQLQSLNELLVLFGFMLALGLIIGMMSTYRAVKKYLKMSLDELY
ncbi:MAG: permease-like cell division protein FtsX [Cytophagales bacterium]|nr:permease-like cell division protein FtsX [Cytophagales bacterium]